MTSSPDTRPSVLIYYPVSTKTATYGIDYQMDYVLSPATEFTTIPYTAPNYQGKMVTFAETWAVTQLEGDRRSFLDIILTPGQTTTRMGNGHADISVCTTTVGNYGRLFLITTTGPDGTTSVSTSLSALSTSRTTDGNTSMRITPTYDSGHIVTTHESPSYTGSSIVTTSLPQNTSLTSSSGNTNSSSGLSPQSKAGMGAGIGIGVIIVGWLAYFLGTRNKVKPSPDPGEPGQPFSKAELNGEPVLLTEVATGLEAFELDGAVDENPMELPERSSEPETPPVRRIEDSVRGDLSIRQSRHIGDAEGL